MRLWESMTRGWHKHQADARQGTTEMTREEKHTKEVPHTTPHHTTPHHTTHGIPHTGYHTRDTTHGIPHQTRDTTPDMITKRSIGGTVAQHLGHVATRDPRVQLTSWSPQPHTQRNKHTELKDRKTVGQEWGGEKGTKELWGRVHSQTRTAKHLLF
jgi:hypothetical protein